MVKRLAKAAINKVNKTGCILVSKNLKTGNRHVTAQAGAKRIT
jgi:hypothetical protein